LRGTGRLWGRGSAIPTTNSILFPGNGQRRVSNPSSAYADFGSQNSRCPVLFRKTCNQVSQRVETFRLSSPPRGRPWHATGQVSVMDRCGGHVGRRRKQSFGRDVSDLPGRWTSPSWTRRRTGAPHDRESLCWAGKHSACTAVGGTIIEGQCLPGVDQTSAFPRGRHTSRIRFVCISKRARGPSPRSGLPIRKAKGAFSRAHGCHGCPGTGGFFRKIQGKCGIQWVYRRIEGWAAAKDGGRMVGGVNPA